MEHQIGLSLQRTLWHHLLTLSDIDKANDGIQEHLMSLVPNYESLAASSKLPLIQSIISSLLMESIFEEYFVGLARDHAHELKKVEALFSNLHN